MNDRSDATDFSSRTEPASGPLWDALVTDTDTAVAVVDQDGTIAFCNAACAKWAEVSDPRQIVGKNLRDFYPPEVADERIGILRRTVTTLKSVTIDGMLRGVFRRASHRALPPDASGNRRVLVVCRTLSPDDAKSGVSADAEYIRSKTDDAGVLATLTPREIEILTLIGRGLSTAEIAKELHRSVKTVEWHRVSLGNKLGINNRVELAHIAIRAGLVSLASRQSVTAKSN